MFTKKASSATSPAKNAAGGAPVKVTAKGKPMSKTGGADPAKTAAGSKAPAFKDGGSVKMPKMCSTM